MLMCLYYNSHEDTSSRQLADIVSSAALSAFGKSTGDIVQFAPHLQEKEKPKSFHKKTNKSLLIAHDNIFNTTMWCHFSNASQARPAPLAEITR